ncbi:unnamed protein product [Dovyalis caffra]|uniref:E3 ubiquitin-protein ligase CHFR cysteine rich domain-containing protein n=1 Tax=Dovyalis caffra TaxID=77055 RepID=A0AAV1R6C0_9ROSI|nr:unnamed protein product [Dovyalis caffra]
MEIGESSSGSNSSSKEVWAKLVPSDSRYSDVEVRSDEMVIRSEITSSSLEKHEWCKITRNSDQSSATMQNKSSNTILVDEATVQNEDDIVINCGSEIIPGPDREEWLRRSQERHASVLCPQCRAVVQFVGRNHFLHSIEEDVLQADSSLKRSDEEITLLDSYASIKSNLIIQTGKKLPRRRSRPALDNENEVADFPCPQCGTEFSGFRCNQNTIHLQCQACGGMMPSRPDIGVWDVIEYFVVHIGMLKGFPEVTLTLFAIISERAISRIPFLAHEKNRHEQDITERCIGQMGKTLQDVISDWIGKLNKREIDRTRMPLNHAEMIAVGTHLLPPDAANREDCWYGYACRTQHHNEDHARKRNHVCRPTKETELTDKTDIKKEQEAAEPGIYEKRQRVVAYLT